MQIPTHFMDKIEQAEPRFAQMVDVEVSIYPSFLNKKTERSRGNHAKKKLLEKGIQQNYRRSPSSQSLLGKRQ